jgi:hypothetical protein
VDSEHPTLLLLQQSIKARQAAAEAVTAVNDAPVAAVPAAQPPQPPEPESIMGTPGTGDIVGDFKRVWRAVFN